MEYPIRDSSISTEVRKFAPTNASEFACWSIVYDPHFRNRYIIEHPDRYKQLKKFTSRMFFEDHERYWLFIGRHFWAHHLTTAADRKAITAEFLIWRIQSKY
uniref:Uncharacterized protein n=1 Tax=Marseillevirus LCMAC101 TaxID=2506602 RepID=A0A481YQJ6_9VIRU|nr:MAG: hypothetical protein LCMAC101_01000 [Marseillevirus LCMAC101]